MSDNSPKGWAPRAKPSCPHTGWLAYLFIHLSVHRLLIIIKKLFIEHHLQCVFNLELTTSEPERGEEIKGITPLSVFNVSLQIESLLPLLESTYSINKQYDMKLHKKREFTNDEEVLVLRYGLRC